MLRKCLRYDFKSVFTYWLFGAITMLILSFPAGLALRSQIVNIENASNRFNWEILVLILYYFAIAAFLLLGSILIYVRYYKHFFSDEGYLTFTLLPLRCTRSTPRRSRVTIFLTTVWTRAVLLFWTPLLPIWRQNVRNSWRIRTTVSLGTI